MSVKLKPSLGELLFLWRRRKNLTQREAARRLKVSVDTYREWEADQRDGQPKKLLKDLTTAETCVLRRRRSGLTQKEVAAELGLTRVWVNRMEKGLADPEALKAYWRG